MVIDYEEFESDNYLLIQNSDSIKSVFDFIAEKSSFLDASLGHPKINMDRPMRRPMVEKVSSIVGRADAEGEVSWPGCPPARTKRRQMDRPRDGSSHTPMGQGPSDFKNREQKKRN